VAQQDNSKAQHGVPRRRMRIATYVLTRRSIGTVGHRPVSGFELAGALYLVMRLLYLKRYPASFDAIEELHERRFRISSIGLHVTLFGVYQGYPSERDAWFLRVAELGEENSYDVDTDGVSAYERWKTLLLDFHPHPYPVQQLQSEPPPTFVDGEWVDRYWAWLDHHVNEAKAAEDEAVLEKASELTTRQTLVTPMAPGAIGQLAQEQNPSALHQHLQEVLAQMQSLRYEDLHPMEAAIAALVRDAAQATAQRKEIQQRLVNFHAQAVPSFHYAMQGVIVSDDQRWEATRHWLIDQKGAVQPLESGELTKSMHDASTRALASFHDDLPVAVSEERAALASAYKVCSMTPGGHVFWVKAQPPRTCARCGAPWTEGQPLRPDRPVVRSAPIQMSLRPRNDTSWAL
jgi:hypothetical protein